MNDGKTRGSNIRIAKKCVNFEKYKEGNSLKLELLMPIAMQDLLSIQVNILIWGMSKENPDGRWREVGGREAYNTHYSCGQGYYIVCG